MGAYAVRRLSRAVSVPFFRENYPCSIPLPSWAPPAPWAPSSASCSNRASFLSSKIKFLASGARRARQLAFAGREYTVEELRPEAFDGVDLAISSTPDDVARDFIPEAVRRGCVVIDESGYWRMDPKVPLVIPEVNPARRPPAPGHHRQPELLDHADGPGAEAAARCGRVRRVVVSTYQATSGAGLAGTRDLEGGTRALLAGEDYKLRVLPPPHRLQLHPADRLAEAPGLHLRRDEDGLRDAEDAGGRFDPGLPHVRPRAGGQLPQREHPGRDRAEDHRGRRPAGCSPPRRGSW